MTGATPADPTKITWGGTAADITVVRREGSTPPDEAVASSRATRQESERRMGIDLPGLVAAGWRRGAQGTKSAWDSTSEKREGACVSANTSSESAC